MNMGVSVYPCSTLHHEDSPMLGGPAEPAVLLFISQGAVKSGGTHLGMERRHPQGLEETEVCWGQRVDAVLIPKVAAGPHRTVGVWSLPRVSPGRVGCSQSLGFRYLGCCCQRSRIRGGQCHSETFCPSCLPFLFFSS